RAQLREPDLARDRLRGAVVALEPHRLHHLAAQGVANRVAQLGHGEAEVEVEEVLALYLALAQPPELRRRRGPRRHLELPVDDDDAALDAPEHRAEEAVRLQRLVGAVAE